MPRKTKSQYLHEYFKSWVKLYKVGAIRDVTLQKYWVTYRQIKGLEPDLKMGELTRQTYQELLNKYAETHERQTVMDFHHQVKAAILDAYDDGIIKHDPTRRAIIKGKNPKKKKPKFLSEFELKLLLKELNLGDKPSLDWLVLLISKTGLRFAEALGVTPNDFDFEQQTLSITKTWNYKDKKGGFQPTKNKSSIRKIQLDWKLCMQFSGLIRDLDPTKPIFITKRIYNSTINYFLEKKCKKADVPVISVHGLRHTHASLLLYAGVSTASVAKRLGHADMTTTQNTYIHIIEELENQDNDKIMRHLAML
ncbi:site-specific integrase [Ligilactobacillus cholophilus]|uniref:site-specific integrase n=1 Tax=Ligilactobacillus cholophilus TaxID=3050131 RepID=UPI0025AFDE4A|nr:site-specific integrase [Ligilactobacillus cholophilus]